MKHSTTRERVPQPIESGPPHTAAKQSAGPLILAADVGGTHARVGLLQQRRGGLPPVELLAWQVYECADWPGLAEILEDFLAAHACPPQAIARCAVAAAGYLRDGKVIAENLHWPIVTRALRDRLHLPRLDVVNDFEALACATHYLPASAGTTVIDATGGAGPLVVVGPGTGLGCAVVVPRGDGSSVLPTEAGHIALAPGNEREIEVLRRLGRDRDYVHTGYVLSGPGLLILYRALAEIDGIAAVHVAPRQVSHAAISGHDALATEALAMFCAMLGSFAGDVAIMFKASAGVYLAGGILPSFRDFLLASGFRARFLNKGVMRTFLASVPVRLIEHGSLGVAGAAMMELPDAVPGG